MTSTAVPTPSKLGAALSLVDVPPLASLGQPRLEIRGGRPLAGEIRVSGAKNSALLLVHAVLQGGDFRGH